MALLFIVIATAATSCLAAPTIQDGDSLKRPSPINPAIPMDPKPTETITVITDPKELAKFKREIVDDSSKYTITAPTTVKPSHTHLEQHESKQYEHYEHDENHDRQKRDTKVPTPVMSTASSLPPKQLSASAPAKDASSITSLAKRKRERTTSITSTTSTTAAANEVKHRQKRAETDSTSAVPLIYRDQHKLPAQFEKTATVTPQTLQAPLQAPMHQTQASTLRSDEAQTLPQFFDAQQHAEMKRDIPVPLVPKYHHPEESPKEKDKHEEHLKNEQTSATSTSTISSQKQENSYYIDVAQVEDSSERHRQHSTPSMSTTYTEHSLYRHQPVPVAELFANAKTSSTTEQAHHQTH